MPVLFLFILLLILIMLYSVTESLRFKVTDYLIEDTCIPKELNGKKVLQLSDLHCISYGKHNYKLLTAVSKLKPDIIFITGDVINGESEKEFIYAENLFRGLATINVPIYYVFGNHELKLQKISGKLFSKYKNLVGKYCTVLNNTCITISDYNIYGMVADKEFYKHKIKHHGEIPSLKKLELRYPYNKYNILLTHDPGFADQYFKYNFNLTMAGHLHGGIIRLPIIGGLMSPRFELFPKYSRGIFTKNNKKIIVSGGLGWHGYIPFRFLNIPEIVRIEFKSHQL